MAVTTAPPSAADHRVRVLIPKPRVLGPVTARRMARALAAYAVLWVLGASVAPGLTFPGAGFFATGDVLLGVASLAGFVLAVFVWWFAGPTILPPIVLVATALLAGDDGDAWPLALGPALLLAGAAVHAARHVAHRRANAHWNDRLRAVTFPITAPAHAVAEHSDADLARLRYALDLALQPREAFDGFTHLDEFREAALRYQLNALAYGLAMSQFTRTPAFTGYLAEAQRNAITKMLDRRVVKYWAKENAWGNLRFNGDPVDTRENIMLTGFHGLMVGMYETLNDDRFSRPGALTYAGRYPNDFHTLAAQVHRGMTHSAYTLFPCEPNWIYAVCNTFGLNTLLSHDRLHGTTYVDDVGAALRASYDADFTRPDGRIIGVRAAHLGLSWNFWAGEAVQLTTAYWMHAGLPEIAQRTWWLIRERGLRIEDGRLRFPSYPGARLDPGNYTLKRDTFSLVVTLMAAREVGDEDYARAAQRVLDEREPTETRAGATRWSDASGLANLYGALGRFGRRSGLRDLVAHGAPDTWRAGPVLAAAAYPDVLVARAVTDGRNLDLTLVPGNGPVRTTLAFERLQPHHAYRLGDATVTADGRGGASVEVELDRRMNFTLQG